MGGKRDTRRVVAWWARRQHGVVTRRQLLAEGVSGREIDGFIARGELRVAYRGVFVAGPVILPHARDMAAVLACGPTAALSHVSAACLYELLPHPAPHGPVHVTVTDQRTNRHEGITVHRSSIDRHEIRERHGVPVTAPIRTLLDLATCSADIDLEAAVAEAFALGLTQRSPLVRAIRPGARGSRRLRSVLDAGPARTRSAPERTLLLAMRAAGLPEPLVNAKVGRWEVDFYWPANRLVVEVDGYAAHSSPRAFERDRRKDAEIAELGIVLKRFTANQVRDRPGEVVERIRRALSRT